MGTLYVHRIDADDVIVFVGEDWRDFARANGAPGLAEVEGKSLWDFVVGPDVRDIYRHMLDRVREDGGSVAFPFRCDSLTLRRFLEMEIVPARGGEVEFRSRLVAVDERPELIALLTAESGEPASSRVVVSCSWCRRFRLEAGWVEPEEAIRELGLFGGVPAPRISHGICEDCARRLSVESGGGK